MLAKITKTIVVAGELRISGSIQNVQTQKWAPSYRVIPGGRLIAAEGTQFLQREWKEGSGTVCNMAIQNDGGEVELDQARFVGGYGINNRKGDLAIQGATFSGLLKYGVYLGDLDNDRSATARQVIVNQLTCTDGGPSVESFFRSQGARNIYARGWLVAPSKKNEKEIIALSLFESAVFENCAINGMTRLGWRHKVGDADAAVGRELPGYAHISGGTWGGMMQVHGNVHVAVQSVVMHRDPRDIGGNWAVIEQTHQCADGRKFTGEAMIDGVKIDSGMKHSAGVQQRMSNQTRWRDIVASANATH